MAFFTEFLPMSEECTTFNCADVSAEDVAYAKSFWQSIQLNPPVESTLTTQKVTQRVKTNKSNASTHNTAITANAAPSVKVGRACVNPPHPTPLVETGNSEEKTAGIFMKFSL